MRKSLKFKKGYKRHKQLLSKYYKNFLKKFNKHKIKFSIIFVVFLSTIWWYFVLNYTIFHPNYTIQEISFNQEDLQNYPYFSLFNSLQWKLLGQNYFSSKYINRNWLVADLQKQHPIIKDIFLSIKWNWLVSIDIDFFEPQFVFESDKKRIWYYWWESFEITSWSKLWTWNNPIYLPDHVASLESLKWMFFEVPPNMLSFQINEIKDIIWTWNIKKIKYIPWWWRIQITTNKWNMIYFNNTEEITWQLQKYHLLKENYPDYKNFSSVDISSGESIIVSEQ